MQDPEPVDLGKSYYYTQFSGPKRPKVLKSDTFYYVPLYDTLKALLQNPDVLNEILHPHQCDDKLSDFCYGLVYKSHPLFSSDPYGLQIIGYYDELEICN